MNEVIHSAIDKGDGWTTYLVFQELLEQNYINKKDHYELYSMIKYFKFPILTNYKQFSAV